MKFGLREITFVVLLMGIPTAAWWFDFRPSNKQNQEMLNQIELRREKLQKLNRATSTIDDMEKEIASLQNAIEFFHSKLPNEKEIDKVLQEVWKLAEANRLTTKSIRTLRSPERQNAASSTHSAQPISVQLEGDFKGLYAFLLSLEKQPRIMQIRKLTLKKPSKCPQGHVQATFEMSIFFEKASKG